MDNPDIKFLKTEVHINCIHTEVPTSQKLPCVF